MIDYHIHTNHSIDAEGSLREYAQRAVALGLKEICFTNHCELDRARNDNLIRFNGKIMPLTREALISLQNEVIALKEIFLKQGLKIRFGIEVGFFPGVEERLNALTEGLKLDYVLAGIHCLDHICIDSSKECETYFQRNNAERLLEDYYNTMELLIRSHLFDAIAHFDVYKKYGLGFYGEKIMAFDRERVYSLFEMMADNNMGLEINTAGLRRIDQYYPSDDFMVLAKQAGIEIITLGSDCHKPDDLGKGIIEAIDYAKFYRFTSIYGFEGRAEYPLTF
ncbi:MAG: histidinol-phosphatase [bacterium]